MDISEAMVPKSDPSYPGLGWKQLLSSCGACLGHKGGGAVQPVRARPSTHLPEPWCLFSLEGSGNDSTVGPFRERERERGRKGEREVPDPSPRLSPTCTQFSVKVNLTSLSKKSWWPPACPHHGSHHSSLPVEPRSRASSPDHSEACLVSHSFCRGFWVVSMYTVGSFFLMILLSSGVPGNPWRRTCLWLSPLV